MNEWKESNFREMEEVTYKVGDIVYCKVSGIQPYGVFAVVPEGNTILIHISSMSKEQQERMNEIQIGSVIPVRVAKATDKDGKLAGSVREFNLEEIIKTEFLSKRDIEEILNYMGKMINDISERAKVEIEKSIKEHGIVKFTMAMMKVVPTFNPDISLLAVQEINKEISGYL